MPTAKHRLVYTPDEATGEAIRSIARLTGIPASRVLSQTVELLAPYLNQLAKLLSQVDVAKIELAAAADQVAVGAKLGLEPYIEQATNAVANLGTAVTFVFDIEPGREKPPSTNRGVRKPKTSTITKRAA
jgi:hypothetical protein